MALNVSKSWMKPVSTVVFSNQKRYSVANVLNTILNQNQSKSRTKRKLSREKVRTKVFHQEENQKILLMDIRE